MKWTVVWQPNAVDCLAELWMCESDQSGLTRLVDDLETALSEHPLLFGESRGEYRRIGFRDWLAVSFAVSEPDRRVYVLSIWRFR